MELEKEKKINVKIAEPKIEKGIFSVKIKLLFQL